MNTEVLVPALDFELAARTPYVLQSCVLAPPAPPLAPDPEDAIYVPVPPGVDYDSLPVLDTDTQLIDTSPDQIIGCANDLPDGGEQQTLNALFPSAVDGDGVVNRTTNDIWVYDGTTWNNVGPTPGPTIVNTPVLPPWNETLVAIARTRTRLTALSLNYGLENETIVDPIVTRTLISVAKITTVSVPAADLTLEVTAPIVSGGASAKPETIQLDLTPSAPLLLTGASVLVPPVTIALAPAPGPIVPREALVITPPALDTTITANTPVVVSGVTVPVPTLDIDTAALAPVVDIFVPPLFGAVTYTGTGSSQSIAGLGFRPGIIWIKRRDNTGPHLVFSAILGTTIRWTPNSATSTTTANSSLYLTSFDTDGFTISTSTEINASGGTYVAWCWPDTGSAASNTDGSITTNVTVDQDYGISTFTYTGNGTSGATIGHGLGVTPDFVITRSRSLNVSTIVGGNTLGANLNLILSTNAAQASSTTRLRAFSSTTIELGTENTVNGSGNNFIGYAFASKTGRSKIDKYTGLGSTPISVDTGFAPQYLLLKAASTTGSWFYLDAARGATQRLIHTTAAEDAITTITFTSTGFTVADGSIMNTNGETYLYMAFR